MTKKQLKINVFSIIIFLTIILIIYVVFYIIQYKLTIHYEELIKLLPLIIAIPATYLGYCFQQRISYLKDLRNLAYNMVNSVREAIKYTYIENPEKTFKLDALCYLSKVIEEVRMFYKNVGQNKDYVGLYPFEPIKEIFKILERLETTSSEKERKDARNKIITKWKELWKEEFLHEFDRLEPSKPVSKYLN
ncbi:MAG TPA: hypothetical protein DDW90_01835 [Cyanobacteria bacterium UBA9971]|nr:hypothetical protein [Cyanobacteria bacterium UBA9971]